MKVGQSIQQMSTVSVDGWVQAQQAWIPKVAVGSILTFDRFITERSFGQKKRIFQIGGGGKLPNDVEAIRDQAGTRYLVSYYNLDIQNDDPYNTIYLIQRADHTAELIEYSTVQAASGAPTGKVENVVTTFPLDFDKITTSSSREFAGVYYSGFIAACPASLHITTDHELRIDGIYYDIEEVYETIGLKGLKLNKRSATQ